MVDQCEVLKVFKIFDDGYKVREMSKDDAQIVLRWFCTLGKICRSDLEVVLDVFPRGGGFYIGEFDGEVVASAIRIPWGPDIFYGSYYFVAEPFRGRGFGTRLRDQVAFDYVGNAKLCIDAIAGKVSEKNEKKFGYKKAFISARYRGIPQKVVSTCPYHLVPVATLEFDKILQYDDVRFVTPGNPLRHECLRRWCEIEGGAAYAAIDDAGDVRGFGVRRPCIQAGYHTVGPLYADDVITAVALMDRLCCDVRNEHVQINVWERNTEWVAMLAQFGLDWQFNAHRMHANGDPDEYKSTTYGFTSMGVCGF